MLKPATSVYPNIPVEATFADSIACYSSTEFTTKDWLTQPVHLMFLWSIPLASHHLLRDQPKVSSLSAGLGCDIPISEL